MKKIISFILILQLLYSCGKSNEVIKTGEKKDFLINIENINNLSNLATFENLGVIKGKSNINLFSQGIGRIKNVHVKEGDRVNIGDKLITMENSSVNYSLNLLRSLNILEKSKISYESTKINLDKQIYDLEIGIERLKNNYETIKKNSKLDIIQANQDLKNTDYNLKDSKSSLELKKLDNSITKMEFDYNLLLSENKNIIDGFKSNIKNEYIAQSQLINDILLFNDKIYDISGLYSDEVNIYKDFLGGNNLDQKSKGKNLLLDLIKFNDEEIKTIDFSELNDEKIINYLNIIDDGYKKIDTLLNILEKIISNSIISIGQLSIEQVDGYKITIDAFQSQYYLNNSNFIAFKNSALSFFNTYKDNQVSLLKQIDIFKNDRDIFIKNYSLGSNSSINIIDKLELSSSESLSDLEIQIKQAEESLEIAKISKNVELKMLNKIIEEAKIGYDLAKEELNKLTITSPINGIISEIFVDEGQEIGPQNQVMTIVSDDINEVELFFKESELNKINVGDLAYIKSGNLNITGSIYSISHISDDSLNYKVIVVFSEKIKNYGGVVTINIPIKIDSILLPIKNIKFSGTNKGIIYIYENGEVKQKEVNLGKMYKDNIEFLGFVDGSVVDDNIFIILSDLSNFDQNKFNLKINNLGNQKLNGNEIY